MINPPTKREAAGALMASWRQREYDAEPTVTEQLDELLEQILRNYSEELDATERN